MRVLTLLVMVLACAACRARPVAPLEVDITVVLDAGSERPCVDACAAGERVCVGAAVASCVKAGGRCHVLGEPVPCGVAEECDAGQCVASACGPRPAPACAPGELCASADPGKLVIDVPVTQLTGRIRLGGRAPVVDPAKCAYAGAAATVEITDEKATSLIRVQIPCTTADFSFSTPTFQGRYRVGVRGEGSNLPAQQFAQLVELGPCTNDLTLDVRTVEVSGRVTVNGAVAPAAKVRFTGLVSRDSFEVEVPGDDPARGFAARVFPGAYRVEAAPAGGPVHLDQVDFGAYRPNPFYLAREELEVAKPLSDLVLDVPVSSLSGQVLMNGAMPVVNAACGEWSKGAAYVSLYDENTRYFFRQAIDCSTPDFGFNLEVYPGTYLLSARSGLNSLGASSSLLVQDYLAPAPVIVGAAPASTEIDVQTVTVTGQVRNFGALPTVSPAHCSMSDPYPFAAYVFFLDSARGYEVSASIGCETSDFSFGPITLFPGEYDVYVSPRDQATDLPSGMYRVVKALPLMAPAQDVLVDVRRTKVPISGRVLVNGAVPLVHPGCLQKPSLQAGFVSLDGVGNDGQREWATAQILCSTTDFTFTTLVAPGTYQVSVFGGSSDLSSIPMQRYLAMPALAVAAPVTGLVLDLPLRSVSATLLRNGERPRVNQELCAPGDAAAAVTLWPEGRQDQFEIAIPCDTTEFFGSTQVFPGVYSVSVAGLPYSGWYSGTSSCGIPATRYWTYRVEVP